ncbi:MAG: ATP-grasp domain-containing protein, partial [Mycobacteriales bacterium]
VEVSEAHHHPAVLELSHRILEQPGWSGPITLQFIDGEGGPVAIEVNPRFGGGVTHAIHCGLDMPAWLLREKLGRDLPPPPEWIDGSLMTRCRRDVFHDPQR